MAIFTNWKFIRIKHSLAKLASNGNLNTIQFHLENEPKIKWFFKKKIHIKDDLKQILINIQRKGETWANLGKVFFFSFWWFIMTGAEPTYLQFSGKENIFSDHSWRETLTELSCSPSPMSSVFSGRGIWGGFPAKWLQLFPRHQSDGVSALVDFGWSLPHEPNSIRAFALRPGALDKHSSFWVLNINIW